MRHTIWPRRRGEQTIEAFREADKIDQLRWQVRGDEVVLPREAEKFRAVGAALGCMAV